MVSLSAISRSRMSKIPAWFGFTHALVALVAVLCWCSGCTVGPAYKRPSAPVAPTYKEAAPESWQEKWKQAQPNEGVLRGKWWEIYNDPALNALEEQVNISNQNVLLAEAQLREARDQIRIARSNLFPSISLQPAITQSRTSTTLYPNQPGVVSVITGSHTVYNMPVDVSYQADVWGSIRRSVRAASATAQASAADLENARLSYHAQLAQIYFEMHGLDSQADLLQRTVQSYREYLQLTRDRFSVGVASGSDVAQAETQLATAQTQLIDVGVLRAQYEHAIAILIGKPPAEVSLPATLLTTLPPPVQAGIPSILLERRPDIAAAERQVAAQNQQIGIATAAFFPVVSLSASAGFESGSISQWFKWPSRFWSLGPAFAQPLFEGGKLHAQLQLAKDTYDATVATYRQAVLTAFQQVEDNMAALRILESEAQAEATAVDAAQRSLDIATAQYRAGTVDYLQVITTQTILLQDQTTAVNILSRRLSSSVLLIEALGGGWDASQLPSYPQLVAHP
jgi:NodT family efflux transporter outer membrane factor (OMF) lipoprotein